MNLIFVSCFFFIKKCLHEYANMFMTQKFQHKVMLPDIFKYAVVSITEFVTVRERFRHLKKTKH